MVVVMVIYDEHNTVCAMVVVMVICDEHNTVCVMVVIMVICDEHNTVYAHFPFSDEYIEGLQAM